MFTRSEVYGQLLSPGKSVKVSSILLGHVLIGRAAFVFPLLFLSNLARKYEKINLKKQVTIWWLGLMHGLSPWHSPKPGTVYKVRRKIAGHCVYDHEYRHGHSVQHCGKAVFPVPSLIGGIKCSLCLKIPFIDTCVWTVDEASSENLASCDQILCQHDVFRAIKVPNPSLSYCSETDTTWSLTRTAKAYPDRAVCASS
ncbi:hypothetical protein NL676_029862 [Syzygium grande]|nr:hypothetical protein NL676_029862 [Syzygium grande]